MELFLLCDAPTDDDMDDFDCRYSGAWDGTLLDNNEFMTPIANFITNSLFGIRHGGKWAGKQLNMMSSLSSSSKDDNGNNNNNSNNSNIGINRFYSTRTKNNDEDQDGINVDIELEHSFAISIAPSSLRRRRRRVDDDDDGNNDDDDDSKKSIMLNYSPYQGILSPWKTMVDELRVLRPPPPPLNTSKSRKDKSTSTSSTRNKGNNNNNDDDSDDDEDDRGILLCVGSMAWSGGYWNGTPFLLVQRD